MLLSDDSISTGGTGLCAASPRMQVKGYAGLRGLPSSASAPGISLNLHTPGFTLQSLAEQSKPEKSIKKTDNLYY
jgi:hypothetical protein